MAKQFTVTMEDGKTAYNWNRRWQNRSKLEQKMAKQVATQNRVDGNS